MDSGILWSCRELPPPDSALQGQMEPALILSVSGLSSLRQSDISKENSSGGNTSGGNTRTVYSRHGSLP